MTDRLKSNIRDVLHELESNGEDREEVAQLLERYAQTVRNGYTELPEDRGAWWHETHGQPTETAVGEVTD